MTVVYSKLCPRFENDTKTFPFHKNEIKIINNLQSEMERFERKDGGEKIQLNGKISAGTAQSLFRSLQHEREISIPPSEWRTFYLR